MNRSSTENLSYDADSNVLSRKTRAGATITFSYDTLNRLSTKVAPSEATVSYAYDQASHLIGVSDNSASIVTPAASASYVENLSYDQLNRPLSATWSPVQPQAPPSTSSSVSFGFTYDATDRRIGQSATDNSWWSYPTSATNVSYTPNNLNQYTAVGSVSPTYDSNGNLTYDGTFTYGYDAENRLISASGSGLTATYAYDAQGRRKSKTVNGTTTIYVTDTNNREVLEYDGTSGAIYNWYAYALGPNDVLNQINVGASTRATLIPDIQGSFIGALDAASGSLTKFGYQTYGESASPNGSFGYTGQRIDPETNGLYYYRARMYSPAWGRFIQTDPVGYTAGSNLYAYVNNDPLNFTDPLGLCDSPQGCGGSSGGNLLAGGGALAIAGIAAVNVVGFPEVEVGEAIAGLGTAAALGGTILMSGDTPQTQTQTQSQSLTTTSNPSGTATIYQQGSHVSIEVQYGGATLHTEQVYEEVPGTPTTIAVAPPPGGGVNSLTLPLPNAQAALEYSQSMIGQPTGPYQPNTNSCVTYCGNVLRAGGLNVPTTTRDIVRYLRGFQ